MRTGVDGSTWKGIGHGMFFIESITERELGKFVNIDGAMFDSFALFQNISSC